MCQTSELEMEMKNMGIEMHENSDKRSRSSIKSIASFLWQEENKLSQVNSWVEKVEPHHSSVEPANQAVSQITKEAKYFQLD